MPSEFSFDVVSEVDLNLVQECVNVAMKEIANRFDFKGSAVSIELNQKEKKLVVRAEDEFKIEAVLDILNTRMAKRGLPLKNFQKGKLEQALGQTARMEVAIQAGIPSEKAKEIAAAIKAEKLKVVASIQGEQVRVAGKSKDELQSAMALIRGKSFGIDLQFKNFR
ncbi:MAG: YajQ family cyclic di-GMP-binding protein [Elusimicrobia bacterium]|nr:YajQ family cyclic di-GMP-binding protein [Elusimicrobiota bacterium]